MALHLCRYNSSKHIYYSSKSLKIFLAKYYGQWTNLDEYYTSKRTFLSPINLGHGSNSSEILLSDCHLLKVLVLVKKVLVLIAIFPTECCVSIITQTGRIL